MLKMFRAEVYPFHQPALRFQPFCQFEGEKEHLLQKPNMHAVQRRLVYIEIFLLDHPSDIIFLIFLSKISDFFGTYSDFSIRVFYKISQTRLCFEILPSQLRTDEHLLKTTPRGIIFQKENSSITIVQNSPRKSIQQP